MNVKKVALSASVLALALVTSVRVNRAQGPLYDKVNVNMPYTVTVGDKVLQPGDYVIRQLPSQGGASRVLLIYSDDGMKFETSAMTIPALDNRTPEDTKVVLHHFGNDYYFDKIWIQGKNYGYEFPLPDAVKARQRERMEPISVAAAYQAVPAEEQTTTAETTPAPQPAPEVAEAQPPAQPQTQPEAQPEAQPAPEAAPAAPPAETAPEPTGMRERREMPKTAANWVLMMLGGGLLSGAGMTLFRRR